ncbi:hypothetical protein BC941DRAFT_195466 [Chlamydoabsidia padenii]|nr:hypothetical protein BC941DRAFT_195466 [Chlamydoabsidia padenii]
MHSSFKSIKRKASEDRLWDGSTCFNGKRRAVSPSVSLSGSPILTASPSSSPTGSSYLYPTSGNAAARNHHSSPSSSHGGFNLHEASGGLSRMSLSE